MYGGGAPHPWRAARDWARGGAHKQSLPKSTTPLSPGRRGGATARSALGWLDNWCPPPLGTEVLYVKKSLNNSQPQFTSSCPSRWPRPAPQPSAWPPPWPPLYPLLGSDLGGHRSRIS
eukprot:scaffold19352_cov66-Phaeocystis_antarctica.AAC.1